ncbi:MAG: STAS domain-containing protein [Turneriella sp.]
MEIKQSTSGPVVIIELIGDMGLYNIAPFKATLEELRQNGNLKIIVNLSKVTGIDSITIGLFILETTRFETSRGALKLSSLSASVTKSFQIINVFSMLEIYDNDAQALASFSETLG